MKRLSKVLLVVACSLPLSATIAASNNSSDVLKYIPADSPYVFASTEPLPDALADKLEPKVDEILTSYRTVLRYVIADGRAKQAEAAEDDGSAADFEKAQALGEELLSLMSVEGIRSAGVERDSAFAFYGHGLLPVFRFELSDEDLFDQTIARFEKRAGEEMAVARVKGEDYKYFDMEDKRLVIATIDEQVVVTLLPTAFDDKQVAMALGLTTPRKSLKKSKVLKSIAKQYGYSDHFVGFIDTIRLAKTFSGELSGLNEDLFALTGEKPPEWSDVCKAELMQLAGSAPRMVFGYTDLTADSMESSFVVEMREDLAAGLASIPAAVPGLGSDPGGFMSIGFGVNPATARDFMEARVTALEEEPFTCEKFAEMQSSVAQMRAALSQPLPPMVYGFRGFIANILDMDGADFATGKKPDSIDATVLVAMENAPSMVMMGAMIDPQLASLDLQPDGKPVKLDFPQLEEVAKEAYAALTDNSLSISVGDGAENNSAAALVAEGGSPAPFMSFSIDAARYYAMIGEAMMLEAPKTDGEPMPPEMRDAIRDMMVKSGSLYERFGADVLFTERGVEIIGRMKIAD